MAKKDQKEEKLNYSAEVRRLKEYGTERLYLLWGQEDYLREQYLIQLKKYGLPEGENEFSCKRLNGPELDAKRLREAIDTVPFFGEHIFVELRDININRLSDADECMKVLKAIPEYCTVAFVQDQQFEPDGRLRFIKNLRALCKELKFTQQAQGMLTDWIVRRFAAAGKRIELGAAQRLIFVSGDLMSRLIPEIEKVAAYAAGNTVTQEDVDAVADHIPEAVVFEMTELISQKKFNSALNVLAELLADKNNEPIMIMAVLGMQMRKLYAAKLTVQRELGKKYLMEVCGIKYEFVANKLLAASKGFKLGQLKTAVRLCAEADYRMKSSSADDEGILKETVMRIAAGECDA